MTLTAGPDSPEDINNSFAILVKRLRRYSGSFEYVRVKETTIKGKPHLHILFRGSYIPHSWLSNAWLEIHNAPIVYLQEVKGTRSHMAGYLIKYLGKEVASRFNCSSGWVFRGFVGFWRNTVRDYGGRSVRKWKAFLQGQCILYDRYMVFDKGKATLGHSLQTQLVY